MSKNHIARFTAKERRICEDTVRQLGGASQKSSCCYIVTVENMRCGWVLEVFALALADKESGHLARSKVAG